MAKARVLAKVGVKAKEGELVYYKNGVLYAVKAKRGGTKGAKHCSVAKKKKAAKKAVKRKAPKKAAKKVVRKAVARRPAKKAVKKKR